MKSFSVFEDGAFYQMSSSIYEEDQTNQNRLVQSTAKSIQPDTVRADILVSVSKMYRDTSDGRIKLVFMTMPDMKMNMPRMVAEPLLVKNTKSWFDNLTKYYVKNQNRL